VCRDVSRREDARVRARDDDDDDDDDDDNEAMRACPRLRAARSARRSTDHATRPSSLIHADRITFVSTKATRK